MNTETLEALCTLVKRKCKITWDDPDTEERVVEIVENAVTAMSHKLGMNETSPEAFLDAGLTKTLFENYCMYDWNNMTEEFDKNYLRDILTERHRYEVENANQTE